MKKPTIEHVWETAHIYHDARPPIVISVNRPWGKTYALRTIHGCSELVKDKTRYCEQKAGGLTPHYGAGKCAIHGGNGERGNTEGFIIMAIAYARAFTISPAQALLDEVHRTAGAIHFLQDILSRVETEDELLKDYAMWVDMYERERVFGIKVNTAAIAAGTMQLINAQQELYAAKAYAFINSVLGDLELSGDQQVRARQLIADRLRAIQADRTEDVDMSITDM